MIAKCPSCGKKFEMMYPSQWAYNINKKEFFCSWKCLQQHRRKKEEIKLGKITLEQKKQAVNIAVTGGDPIAFLKECGSDKPGVSWSNILRYMEKENPKAYDLITARKKVKVDKWMPKQELKLEAGGNYDVSVKDAMDNMQEAADEFFGKCEEIGMKVSGSVQSIDDYIKEQLDGYEIGAIRHKNFGEFYYDRDHNCIDWRAPGGDEVSLSVNGWKGLIERLPRIMRMLGVEL